MLSDIPPVTRALLFANVAVYLLQMLLGDSHAPYPLTVPFALWPLGPSAYPAVPGFQIWQLVTYAFLHGSFQHIAFNMLALWMFGGPIEELFGSRPFALYYFVCVIGAALTQLAVMHLFPQGYFPTLGASGGVFGLLLAYGMMYPNARILVYFAIPVPAWLFVSIYGVLELFLGVTGTQAGVAHFAHLGGLAFGFVLIMYWRGRLPWKPRRILMR
jgi:membrane associated rhomboid family serine protease